MAALSIADRTRVWRGLMRYLSNNATAFPWANGVSKFDLYNPSSNTGAIASMDDWIDTHGGNTTPDTVGLNGVLSEPFKSNASLALKTLVFLGVASMRVGIGFARTIFGEVD